MRRRQQRKVRVAVVKRCNINLIMEYNNIKAQEINL